ncbi:hypothetical protein SAMN04515671_1446 [Nakamurella panacisegetis]|uniref:Uncharacterized protein n=1 Tax=Nakamurella panacisegetis TaxID=1090615 RepID=A0A1H0KVA8_9ACTN|nr:hypothetical protein [Nakamurella panacisegetis]SDO59954.1 hypothetical protein SAMN04515671_1446 [Nakamurella panacisegetis]
MSDPARVEATVAQFEAGLRDSLESSPRIRGWVSDQLFGLVAADLGGCKLVKQEDAGVLFYKGGVKLPDWRLTLVSDKNILVEVKAEDNDHPRVSTLRLAEVARLKSYADLNDCPLYIAVHWVAMSMWTLVPIDDYVRVGDHFEIDLKTAFQRNHMCSLLNDRMLGLKPPLEFRLTMEETPDEDVVTVGEPEPEEDGTRKLSLVTTGVRLFAGGEEMVDKSETALVWFLLQHSRWPCEERIEDVGDGLWEMVFAMAPEESHADQGFDVRGTERAVHPHVLLQYHLARGRNDQAQHRRRTRHPSATCPDRPEVGPASALAPPHQSVRSSWPMSSRRCTPAVEDE